jgi:hypothetical protein
MTTTQAAPLAYRVLGTTDDITDCDQCGRDDLKSTVILGHLDADGNVEGVRYVGSDCGARLSGQRASVIASGARKADRAAREAANAAYDAVSYTYGQARDLALVAWITKTYGVTCNQPADGSVRVPNIRAKGPYHLIQEFEAAGSPGFTGTRPDRSQYTPDRYRGQAA